MRANAVSNVVKAFPAIKPGYELVPAKIGRTNATSTIVYIECPRWCTVDHVDDPVNHIEDVMHLGDPASVYVWTFGTGGAAPIQLHAEVQSDPTAEDPQFQAAHIVVGDAGGSAYSYLTPDMADRLADEVVGFASQLRHQARTARLHNQTVADSDPSMNEALRRVRA